MSDPVRHGFARVIDHSAEADEVTVAVIDDAGMRAGPVEVCGVNDEGDGAWSTGGCGITSTTSAPATGAPTISGTAQAGEEPTAGKGTITDTDGTTKADNGDTGSPTPTSARVRMPTARTRPTFRARPRAPTR